MSVPIAVLAGYLGSGKTTLLNRLLASEDDLSGLAVLVNDFGSVNVDAEHIRGRAPDANVLALTNGCVCCSVQGDLAGTLESLRTRDVQRIWLEASGVALPGKLRQQCAYPGFHAHGVWVTVDARHHGARLDDAYVGDLAQRQVVEADVLLITKTDAVSKAAATAVRQRLAPAHKPVHDSAAFQLVEVWQGNAVRAETTAVAPAVPFVSATLPLAGPVSADALVRYLTALPPGIARVKGFATTGQESVSVNVVAGSPPQLMPYLGVAPQALVFVAPAEAEAALSAAVAEAASALGP